MRPNLSMWGGAALSSAILASSASAGSVETAQFTIHLTNPTGIDWQSVLFVIEPDEQSLANQPGYAQLFDQIVFPEVIGSGGQEIAGKNAQIVFDDPQADLGEKEVLFDFAQNDPLTANDGFVSFFLTVETPDLLNVPFEIRVQPIFVPTPGGLALFGLGALTLVRRRSA